MVTLIIIAVALFLAFKLGEKLLEAATHYKVLACGVFAITAIWYLTTLPSGV